MRTGYSRPGGSNDSALGQQLTRVLPSQYFKAGVSPGNEVELRAFRVSVPELPHRVYRKGRPLSPDLRIRYVEMGAAAQPASSSGAGPIRRISSVDLVRGTPGRHEDHLAEIEGDPGFLGGNEVPVVNRVECASHKSDSLSDLFQ